MLDDVAHRANTETQAYIQHTARFTPFEDPIPVLRELGYATGRAKMLSGYGDTSPRAIHGLITQGWDSIPDCTYTKYGLDLLVDADAGYALAVVILAGG
ncbi:hypothetical protein ACRDU6_09935 [Mycolicibacterium sp. ELW1]|uniref:hypothetical protein n=1 Tax=Mycobacteriaceae TaxID=1762 RepID=UPI0011EFE9B2|nr:hypothetical protein [Mycobacterium sp. ELW1]QEN12952.1 hypothetical protein D3H54_06490 [Mycobacterium sp. ELW1]